MQLVAIRHHTLYFDWKFAFGMRQRLLQPKKSTIQLDLVDYTLFHRQLPETSLMQAVAEKIELQYTVASCCTFFFKIIVFYLASSYGNIFAKVLLGILGFFLIF